MVASATRDATSTPTSYREYHVRQITPLQAPADVMTSAYLSPLITKCLSVDYLSLRTWGLPCTAATSDCLGPSSGRLYQRAGSCCIVNQLAVFQVCRPGDVKTGMHANSMVPASSADNIAVRQLDEVQHSLRTAIHASGSRFGSIG
jgi:hypothetical protein